MRMPWNRTTVKLGGRKIKVKPMPARQGLETVVQFSDIIHKYAPRLALIASPERTVRLANILRIVGESEELPDLLLNLVVTGTGLPLEQVEEATTHEVLKALAVIVKVNDWDAIWQAAYDLRIIDREGIADWLWSRVPQLRTG